jgi:hypothetical protein
VRKMELEEEALNELMEMFSEADSEELIAESAQEIWKMAGEERKPGERRSEVRNSEAKKIDEETCEVWSLRRGGCSVDWTSRERGGAIVCLEEQRAAV